LQKKNPLWGEETRLPFSGTLPLGKAGLLLLCPGPRRRDFFVAESHFFALEEGGGGTFGVRFEF
jgi:hypothetical protein